MTSTDDIISNKFVPVINKDANMDNYPVRFGIKLGGKEIGEMGENSDVENSIMRLKGHYPALDPLPGPDIEYAEKRAFVEDGCVYLPDNNEVRIQVYVAMKAREIIIVAPTRLLNQDANSLFDVPVKNTQEVDPASDALLGVVQIIAGISGEENDATSERPDLSFDGPIGRDDELFQKEKKTDAEKAKQREERMFKDE
jgi:hypothetical protein